MIVGEMKQKDLIMALSFLSSFLFTQATKLNKKVQSHDDFDFPAISSFIAVAISSLSFSRARLFAKTSVL